MSEELAPQATANWAPAFTNRQTLDFEANQEYFTSCGFDCDPVDDKDFGGSLRKKFDMLETERDELRILVDISSMSRLRMATVLDELSLWQREQVVTVDFIYSVAKFLPPTGISVPIVESGPVTPRFAGWTADPTRRVSAIFGVGYEQDQVLGVVEYLETDAVWTFLPHGPDERYIGSLLTTNETLWDVVPESRRLAYKVVDGFSIFRAVETLVYGILAKRRPVLVPFGPKIFAVSAMIAAAVHAPDVAVWRVSTGQSSEPRNREGDGNFSAITLQVVP